MNGARNRMLVPIALAACMGCTDRDVLSPDPDYFALFGGAQLDPEGEPRPASACPPLDSVAVTTQRHGIPGSTASIAVPLGARTVNLLGGRGLAIQVANQGTLGITYDDVVMLPAGANFGGGRFPNYTSGVVANSWCQITVGGRDAVMFVEAFQEPVAGIDPRTIPFGPVATISTITPAGRRVNIVLFTQRFFLALDPPPADGEQSVALRRLLRYVGTLQW